MSPPGARWSRAKRSLSQNFLIDPNLQRKTVAELAPQPGERVLEVGPGHGELSQHLLGRMECAVLVEKDRDLAADLRTRWAERSDIQVVEGDALELDLGGLVDDGFDAVLSNVPYNISSPLLFRFLELRPAPSRIVVTVQRELAERIVSPPGSKVYGALSVGVQAAASARIAFPVPRSAFRPRPDVDSAVLTIVPDPDGADRAQRAGLRSLTRAAFSRRRKQMQRVLRDAGHARSANEAAEILTGAGIDPAARPETIDPTSFVTLAERLRID